MKASRSSTNFSFSIDTLFSNLFSKKIHVAILLGLCAVVFLLSSDERWCMRPRKTDIGCFIPSHNFLDRVPFESLSFSAIVGGDITFVMLLLVGASEFTLVEIIDFSSKLPEQVEADWPEFDASLEVGE